MVFNLNVQKITKGLVILSCVILTACGSGASGGTTPDASSTTGADAQPTARPTVSALCETTVISGLTNAQLRAIVLSAHSAASMVRSDLQPEQTVRVKEEFVGDDSVRWFLIANATNNRELGWIEAQYLNPAEGCGA
jgi:hypothetical protein